MSKRIEIRLKPEQDHLQDAILEFFRDVHFPTPRTPERISILSVPVRDGAVAFLDNLGVQYKLPEYRKPGPKSSHEGLKTEFHLKFDEDLASFIKSEARQGYQAFFNEILRQKMQERDLEQSKISS
jgi:uncharacterized protein (DUF4415 family)